MLIPTSPLASPTPVIRRTFSPSRKRPMPDRGTIDWSGGGPDRPLSGTQPAWPRHCPEARRHVAAARVIEVEPLLGPWFRRRLLRCRRRSANFGRSNTTLVLPNATVRLPHARASGLRSADAGSHRRKAEHRACRIAGSASRGGLHMGKAQRCQIQLIDEGSDHASRVIGRNMVFKTRHRKTRLITVRTFNETSLKAPPKRRGQ